MFHNRVWYFSLFATVVLQAGEVINLEEITVTGTRAEEATVSQGLSINKKSSKEIELDQVVFQKDLLNSLSNVLVTQTSSGVGHMLSVRTPISTNPYFLYLQDGIPVQSSGFFNHNALAYTSFESADSVEVLKGAGTALYGSDAISAVVNVNSAKLDGKKENKVKLNVGTEGYQHTYLKNSGTMGEATNYEVGVGFTNNDGYRDHSSHKRFEATAKFDTMINDENNIETSLSFNKTEADQAGVLTREELDSGSTSVGDIKSKLDKVDPQRKFDFIRASVKWNNYSFDDLEISTIGYLRDTRNRYTATWQNNLPQNDSEQRSFGLMHQTIQKTSWGKNIFGLDAEYTKGTNKYTQSFDYTPTRYGSPVDAGLIYDYDVDYSAFAPYLQSTINISKKFSAIAGLRFDYSKFDYNNNTDSGNYGNSSYYRPENRKDSFHHLSPKLTINYQASKDKLLYARFANAFRIPSATRLYSQSKTSTLASNFSLNPETSNTYEIGYKQRFNKSSIDVALYQMDIDDTIIRREDANKDRYYENGGKSKHKGIEISYEQKLNDTFSTAFAGSYSKSNYVNDAPYGNNEMPSAPSKKANLRLIYTPKNYLTMMLEAQYISDYFMDDTNEHTYEGYTIGNLKANYQVNKNLNLFTKINNITDEKYAEKADFSYGKEKYTPAYPRMFFVGGEYTF